MFTLGSNVLGLGMLNDCSVGFVQLSFVLFCKAIEGKPHDQTLCIFKFAIHMFLCYDFVCMFKPGII